MNYGSTTPNFDQLQLHGTSPWHNFLVNDIRCSGDVGHDNIQMPRRGLYGIQSCQI